MKSGAQELWITHLKWALQWRWRAFVRARPMPLCLARFPVCVQGLEVRNRLTPAVPLVAASEKKAAAVCHVGDKYTPAQPRKSWFCLWHFCITEAARCLGLLGFFFELDVLQHYRIMKSEEKFQLHQRVCWFVSEVMWKRDEKVCLGYKCEQTESAAETHIWQFSHTTGSCDDQRWSHSCQQNAFTSISYPHLQGDE